MNLVLNLNINKMYILFDKELPIILNELLILKYN